MKISRSEAKLLLIIILLISSIAMLADSIISWPSLSYTKKPLNWWYSIFSCSGICLSTILLVDSVQKQIPNKLKRVVECFIFLIAVLATCLVTIGVTWLVQSLLEDPYSIPLRMKVELFVIQTICSMIIAPMIIIAFITFFKMILWFNAIKKKADMKFKLEYLHREIYKKEFEFSKIVKDQNAEFLGFPLKEREIEVLQKEFSVLLTNNEEYKEGCSICYTEFKKGELMTTIPNCNHQFHFDCIEIWIKTQATCPCCRDNIRKSLIEYYHGKFDLKGEKEMIESQSKKVLVSEVFNMEMSSTNLSNQLVEGQEMIETNV